MTDHGSTPVGWDERTHPGWGAAWHAVAGTGPTKNSNTISGRGFAVVAPMTPPVCSACGRTVGAPVRRPHPWGCPVLVRLAAQLLAAADPDRTRWRLAAGRCAADAVGGPWCREADHWRAVRDAAEPPDPRGGPLLTPLLVPTGDGMAECDQDTPGAAPPGGGAIVAPGGRLRAWLDSQAPGWVSVPPAFGTLELPDPEPAPLPEERSNQSETAP